MVTAPRFRLRDYSGQGGLLGLTRRWLWSHVLLLQKSWVHLRGGSGSEMQPRVCHVRMGMGREERARGTSWVWPEHLHGVDETTLPEV
jgi:hypothetical protein